MQNVKLKKNKNKLFVFLQVMLIIFIIIISAIIGQQCTEKCAMLFTVMFVHAATLTING